MRVSIKNKVSLPSHWDFTTPEEEIASWIDVVKSNKFKSSSLLPLLHRNNGIYRNRSTNQINRLRGYAIACFEHTGVPKKALVFICEELDNGHAPYLLAACAKALRAGKWKSKDLQYFLVRALQNLGHKDEVLSFESYRYDWPLKNSTSATLEVLKTLGWLGGYAKESISFLKQLREGLIRPIDENTKTAIEQSISLITNDSGKIKNDCCNFIYPILSSEKISYTQVKDITIEDQEGDLLSVDQFLKGQFTVVAFFYTRCDNPTKCSLTVTRVAQLQNLIDTNELRGINLCCISYDSQFDNSRRLKFYSENRGIKHNETCKTFRVPDESEMELLISYFNSSVNYTDNVVNNHSIELFVLNFKGAKVKTYTMFDLNVENIYKDLVEIKRKKFHFNRAIKSTLANTGVSFLFIFFPKCPICWAAYLSALGITGVSWLKYYKDLIWVVMLLTLVNIFFIYRGSRRDQNYLPLFIAIIGYSVLTYFLFMKIPIFFMYFSGILVLLASIMSVTKYSKKNIRYE